VVIDRCFVFNNLSYNLVAALVPPFHLSNDTDHGTGAVPFKADGMTWNCISCKRDFNNYTHPTFQPDYPVCDKCWYWHEEYREACYEHEIYRQKSEPKKKPIPADIRWAVWERDNFTCQHCGGRRNLTVDHIYPESKGGEMTMDNAQTLCKTCNSRKGAR
jgi:5-methylcytosine-specific restriction endonuclease McrA